jgi:tRNA G26 N,N-dimethylase Trm1
MLVEQHYPELVDVLPYIYGHDINKSMKNTMKKFDHIDMDIFGKKTSPKYYMFG